MNEINIFRRSISQIFEKELSRSPKLVFAYYSSGVAQHSIDIPLGWPIFRLVSDWAGPLWARALLIMIHRCPASDFFHGYASAKMRRPRPSVGLHTTWRRRFVVRRFFRWIFRRFRFEGGSKGEGKGGKNGRKKKKKRSGRKPGTLIINFSGHGQGTGKIIN